MGRQKELEILRGHAPCDTTAHVGTAGSSDLGFLSCAGAHCISLEGKCFHYAQKQYLASVMHLFLEGDHTAEAVSCGRLPVASAVNHGAFDIFAMGLCTKGHSSALQIIWRNRLTESMAIQA